MDDLISRQAALDAVNSLIDRFERILSDIRESRVDDSVCGLCEYDGAYMGQSGDWCNECPGFDKDNCFKLSDECRKRWLESVELPSATEEKRTADEARIRTLMAMLPGAVQCDVLETLPYMEELIGKGGIRK